jgi:hypothetical protein
MYKAAADTFEELAIESHVSPFFVVYRLPVTQYGAASGSVVLSDGGMSVGFWRPH